MGKQCKFWRADAKIDKKKPIPFMSLVQENVCLSNWQTIC
ncbi:MAG: hypothetical protein ALMCE001_08540 [Methanocorpusculum sp. MCE]|nr:MAG: hypothetical protein ALMCE001_08540 [Methanocorpusculum sp. MCE]